MGICPMFLSAVFNYPNKGINLTMNGTLKNGIYRENYIMGSEAAMYVDLSVTVLKDDFSERYKNIREDKLFTYAGTTDVDAISSATSKRYMKGGYGPTYIDGKVIDATHLHLKEWFDAIRNQGKTSCDIDVGFEEAVTFNLANLAYVNNKIVSWDPVNEKAVLS